MPTIEDVLDRLEIELDKRLRDLSNNKLIEIAQTLVANLDKKALTTLISDEDYFSLTNIVKWLEKQEKDVLLEILNEPKAEAKLRRPVDVWLRDDKYATEYEVPLPVGGRGRAIDVCGFKSGIFGTNICAVELKTDATRGAIDKAFSQAKDNARGADKSYIAFSPFVYLKYADVIMKKLDTHMEVGLLIADAMRVVVNIDDPKESGKDDDIYESVKEYMESR